MESRSPGFAVFTQKFYDVFMLLRYDHDVPYDDPQQDDQNDNQNDSSKHLLSPFVFSLYTLNLYDLMIPYLPEILKVGSGVAGHSIYTAGLAFHPLAPLYFPPGSRIMIQTQKKKEPIYVYDRTRRRPAAA